MLTPFCHVLGMDDRGHGKTSAPADPGQLKNWGVFANDLTCFLESLPEPVIAAGHSRGAVVSLLVAARRPDLVRALILIDPAIMPFYFNALWYLRKKLGLVRRRAEVKQTARRRKTWPSREVIRSAYLKKYPFSNWKAGFLDSYLQDGIREAIDGQVELSCDPFWEAEVFATFQYEIWRTIRQIQCPVLVVHGMGSNAFPPSAARSFKAKVPSTLMVGLPETSHFVPMERPEETVRAILDFLKKFGLL
jgi:pimeloyl-ACP methyl ester carboxylesterase